MNMVDKISMRGQISVRALRADGKCVFSYEFPNTITYTAPLVLLDLLCQPGQDDNTAGFANIAYGNNHPDNVGRGFSGGGGVSLVNDPAKNCIRYMRVGSSSVPAIRQQDGLGTAVPLGTSVISEVEFPENSSARFLAVFDTSQANDQSIREVSLWTRGSSLDLDPGNTTDSRMFARQIHPEISKTDQLSLEYAWTIYFT